MTGLLASIRPESWNLPLFLHVLGAMVLVGAVTTGAATSLFAAGSAQPDRLRRLSFRTLLLVGLPAYVVMRVGAQWIYSKEFGDVEDDPAWIGVGYVTADLGGLVFLVSLALSGVASWKSKTGLGRAAGIVAALALAGWLVAVWAMGAKPD